MSDSLGDLIVRLGFDPSGLDSGASAIEKRLEQTGTRLYFMGSRIAAGFSAPLGVAVGVITKFGLEFDQAMTESLAIMDRVTPQIRSKMEAQARAISESTKFTATEGAKAYYSLASAGMSAAQATEALPVVARFAQAGVMDLAKASDALAAVQTGLGLRTNDATQNMMNMKRVSDVLVDVNNRALGKVSDYTAALERSAGSLRLYNKSIEEGAAVLAAYADKGILGANAGQQLYMVLRDLANAAVKQPEHFKQAGIAVFDASGHMRNMADIIDDMTKKFNPLSDAGKRTEITFLGLTSRSQNALLPLLGMGNRIREVQTALEGAGGATETVAGKQMESLQNQIHVVTEKFKNLGIELFQSFLPVIREQLIPLAEKFVAKAKEWSEWLQSLDQHTKLWLVGLVAAGVALGPVIMMMGSFLLTIRAIISPITELVGFLAKAWPAAEALAVEGASVGTAFSWLGWAATAVELFLNPWILIPAAIAGVALAVRELTGSWEGTWNVFKILFPGLALIPGLFQEMVGTGKWVYSLFSDLGAILNGVVRIGFSYLQDVFKWIASVGANITAQGVKSFVLYATGIGEARDAFVWFRDTLEGWFPVVKKVREWLMDMLGGAFSYVRDKIHELAEAFRNFTGSVDLPNVTAPKPNIAGGPSAVLGPGGMSVDQYLDSIYGSGGGGGGAAADSPATTRTKNILERISGKTAFEDAQAWTDAIKKLGGVGKLATDDLDQALKVFDTAYDRAIKLHGANNALANSYADIWAQLQKIKEAQGGAHFDSATGIAALGWHIPISDMQHDANMAEKMSTGHFGVGNDPFAGVGWRRSAADIKNDMPKPIDFTKEWAKSVATMGTVASEMNRLGREVGGSLGSLLQGLGTFFTIANVAGKAGLGMKGGFGQLTNPLASTNEKVTGGVNMAMGALQAVASWSAATNNKSMAANVGGGAMAGASAGAAFGPIGMGVGAAVGAIGALIKGKPEWAKLQSDIGRDMGVTISDELAKAMEKDSKKFGRAATNNMHLSEIIGEAGGLNAGNLDMFTGKLRDTFAMLGQGTLSASQATKTLNDNFTAFAAAGTDGYGRLSKGLKEIIGLNQQYGTDSKAIGDYLKGQGTAAMQGWIAVADGMMEPYVKLHEALDGVKIGSSEYNDIIAKQSINVEGAKQELSDLGTTAVATYAAAVAAGMSESDALRKIAPQLSQMRQTYQDLGLDVDNVALKNLMFQSNLLEKNPKLIDAVGGLTGQMIALDNMGLLNVDTFGAMERQGFQMFGRLLASSTEMGGGAKEALLPLQDWLHQAEEQARLLNIPLDAGTQSLVDQSKELGIWKEKGKSATDKLIDGVSTLVDKMDQLIRRLTGMPDANFTIHGHYDVPPPPDTGGGGLDLPEMAGGGVVNGPTPVIAGEAGPEAIMPLRVLQHMLDHQSNNMTTVILEVDGREMARKTVQHMPSVLRENGLFT